MTKIEPVMHDNRVHALEKRERIFEIVARSLENFPLGIFITTAKGEPVYANKAARQLLNKKINQLPVLSTVSKLPKGCQAYVAGTDHLYPKTKSPLARALAGEICAVDDMEIRQSDRVVPIEVSAAPICDENGDLIYALAVFKDTTEYKRAEEKEKRRIRDLMSLSSRAVEFINLSPEDDIFLLITQQLKELIGDSVIVVNSFDEISQLFCTRAVLGIGKKTNALLKLLGTNLIGMTSPINDKAGFGLTTGKLEKVPGGLYELSVGAIPRAVCNSINKLLNLGDIFAMGFAWNGKLYGSAAIFLHKGTELQDPRIIEIFMRQASLALQRRQAEEALRNAKEELEIRVKERTVELAKANEELRLEILERTKRTDELHRACADLEKTHQELVQSEKLAALGRFSSGITHELKNPLGVVLGGVEYLEKILSQPGRDVKIALHKIREATLRANSIVQGILKLAKPSELTIERIKLNDLIKETLSLFKYSAPLGKIKIETHFLEESLYIGVDKNQMQQVLINLLKNSYEAMPKNGVVVVKTSKLEKSEMLDRRFCLIEVLDSGDGISEENLQRLFEPFFTTKETNKGTGLGLFMSKLIINNHRGKLEIDSKLGEGTTAKIILPLVQEEV